MLRPIAIGSVGFSRAQGQPSRVDSFETVERNDFGETVAEEQGETKELTEQAPSADVKAVEGGASLVAFSGAFIAELGSQVEALIASIRERVPHGQGGEVSLDLAGVTRLDTLGAWTLNKLQHNLSEAGFTANVVNNDADYAILLKEGAYKDFFADLPPKNHSVKHAMTTVLADIGKAVIGAKQDIVAWVAFLGEVVVNLSRYFRRSGRGRFPSVVNQLEVIAFRGLPIVALICFVVGCIIAQQGIFQLRTFGATPFVVDLIGILTLRELGVLLAAIMVAGRSGSAFTAEIGSMKMNEEIDALRVMGLSPIEVLILPRLMALIIALPLLTFLGSMAAILGGGLTTWVYGGISPDVFLSRLQVAIGMNTFLVGLIKAPFMAFVIGIIATIEGLSVEGSAESLGRRVTSSVVKSIFMVIVMDGLFAIFFAAINY